MHNKSINYSLSVPDAAKLRRLLRPPGFANGVYSISFKKVVEGFDEYLLPHTLEPNSIERINLVFGGDFSDRESYLARITLTIYTGGGKEIETEPVTILSAYSKLIACKTP